MKLIASPPAPGALWCVRGTTSAGDIMIVVESVSRAEAEAAGWRRGINVVIVSEATKEDVAMAQASKLLYRFTPPPRLRCWGRAVTYNQAASLVLCALAVIVLDLRAWHVPMHFGAHGHVGEYRVVR